MATIANLSIGLSADSAGLKKDLDKAGHLLRNGATSKRRTLVM